MNLKALVLIAGFACIAPVVMHAQSKSPDGDVEEINVAREAESLYTMRVRGELAFDTSGKVVEHRYSTQVEPAVAAGIDRAIATWRFQPYMKDGAAVAVRTPFEVTLAGRETVPGKFEVKVESARFGNSKKSCAPGPKCKDAELENEPRLPGYPKGLMKSGVSGMVLVYLKIDPEGRVLDASVAQSALFNIKGRTEILSKARKNLERECLIYSRKLKWKAGTGDPVGGSDINRMAALPFVFKMTDAAVDNVGTWRFEARGPKQVAAWLQKNKVNAPGVSDVDGKGLIAMDSEYLLTEGQPQG